MNLRPFITTADDGDAWLGLDLHADSALSINETADPAALVAVMMARVRRIRSTIAAADASAEARDVLDALAPGADELVAIGDALVRRLSPNRGEGGQ